MTNDVIWQEEFFFMTKISCYHVIMKIFCLKKFESIACTDLQTLLKSANSAVEEALAH